MTAIRSIITAALLCAPTLALSAPIIGGTTAATVTADTAALGLDVTAAGTTTTSGSRFLFDITGGDADPATLAGTILHAGAGLDLATSAGLVTLSNFTIDTVARRVFADVAFNGSTMKTGADIFRFKLKGFTTGQITDITNPIIPLLITGRTSQLLFSTLNLPRLAGQQFAVVATAPTFTAVPEPAAWSLLILGFGAIGAGMRRRKTTVTFARA